MKLYIAAIAALSMGSVFCNEIFDVKETVEELRTISISETARAIQDYAIVSNLDAKEIASMLCKHSHTPAHKHGQFAQENIDAIKNQAKESRNQGVIDGIKSLENAIHLKPGHSIEDAMSSSKNLRDAISDYKTASEMQDRLDHGRIEVFGNGVLLRP
jgi:hypothetical protein